MVRAGATMSPGQTNVQNDPFCVDELFKHMCLYKKNKLKEEKEKEDEKDDSPTTK